MDPLTIVTLLAGSASLISGIAKAVQTYMLQKREKTLTIEIEGRTLELRSSSLDRGQLQKALDAVLQAQPDASKQEERP